MKRYKVISYDAYFNAHRCQVEGEPYPRLVDLRISDLTRDMDPGSMIGKIFEADYDHPYLAIASHPREVKEGA